MPAIRFGAVVLLAAAACADTSRQQAHSPDSSQETASPLVYSTMLYNNESGDLNGTEISVRRLQSRWLATYQDRDNAPRCDTLIMTGDGTRFSIQLKPDSGTEFDRGSQRIVEIHPSWLLDGTVVKDTLRAVVHMRWRDGYAKDDTLRLPRVAKAYFAGCAGAG